MTAAPCARPFVVYCDSRRYDHARTTAVTAPAPLALHVTLTPAKTIADATRAGEP